jgi:putative Ca2+/H+ antiporter (TMEM165/GDT1 family)
MAQPILAHIESLQEDSSFVPSTLHSLAVILITEIGDKTFFIAAVLAMRYGRVFVYSGAMRKLFLFSNKIIT